MKKALATSLTAILILTALLFGTAGATGVEMRMNPDVAHGLDTYLVVYYYEFAGVMQVRGQILDNQGNPMGPETIISDPSALFSWIEPKVAPSKDGQSYLVVWADARNWEVSDTDIFGQWVSDTGQVLQKDAQPGFENFTITNAPGDQNEPDITPAHNGVNKFFMAWTDTQYEAVPNIYGARLGVDGSPIQNNIPISDSPSVKGHPALAYDAVNNRALVVFHDDRNSATLPDLDIYGQFIDDAGLPLFTSTVANLPITSAMNEQRYPTVAIDHGVNRFLVAWEDERVAMGTSDIYGQVVNDDSTFWGGNFVISNAPLCQMRPDAAWDENSRFGVVWEDNRENGPYEIYGQVVDNQGGLVNTPPSVNVRVAGPVHEFNPALAHGDSFVVAWTYESVPEIGDYNVDWTRTDDNFQPPPPSDFLAGWWKMDEGAGEVIGDSSGNDNTGQATGTEWTHGLYGGQGTALGFDGAAMVTAANSASLDITGTITVSAWVRPWDTDTLEDRFLLAKTQDPNKTAGFFSWALVQNGTDLIFRVSSDGVFDGSGDGEAIGYGMLAQGTWNHVAASWDGANLVVFVNGRDISGQVPYVDGLFSSTAPVTMGTGSGYFQGDMADARVYATALDENQVRVEAGMTSMVFGQLTSRVGAVGNQGVGAWNMGNGFWMDAVSDAGGNYTLYVIPGCYNVEPFPLPGYQTPRAVELFVFPEEQGGSRVDFLYESGVLEIEGRVTVDGVGLDQVAVTWNSSFTMTDAEGYYTLTSLVGGEGILGFHPDAPVAQQSFHLNLSSNIKYNVDLPMGGALIGWVADANGDPVPGAEIEFTNDEYFIHQWADPTFGDGAFEFEPSLPPGLGFLRISPPQGSYLCSLSDVGVNVESEQIADMGIIKLLPGALVQGTVMGPDGEPASCVRVFARGAGFEAEAMACNGQYSMIMPAGTHTIYLDQEESGLPSPLSACPVEVDILLQDVALHNTVTAPQMTLYDGRTGFETMRVEVPSNEFWTSPPTGELQAVAVPQDALAPPVNLSAMQPVNGVVVENFDQSYVLEPLCPGTYDVYLIWAYSLPDGSQGWTYLDMAGGIVVGDGIVRTATLNVFGEYSPQVTGRVVDDQGNGVPGATVWLTAPDGTLMGYVETDANGNYLLYNVPGTAAGITLDANAFKYGLLGMPQVTFQTFDGQNIQVPDLTLGNVNYLGASVQSTFRVSTWENTFDGAQGAQAHVRQTLWFDRPFGVSSTLVGPMVGFEPGQAVENVFAEHTFDMDGFQEEAILPNAAENPNTPDPRYLWLALPDLDPATIDLGIHGAESMVTANAIPVMVTRTVAVAPEAVPYTRAVLIEAVVSEPGVSRLDLDIYEIQSPIGWTYFVDPPNFGDKEALVQGLDQGWETWYPEYGFKRYSVNDPVPGQVYSFASFFVVNPENNEGAVDITPKTRVRLRYDEGQASYSVDGNELTINEPDKIGQVTVIPQNDVDWYGQRITKSTRMEVLQMPLITEIGAQGPGIAFASPEPDSVGVDLPNDPITIVFTKSMNPGAFWFRLQDQWGNVIHDSRFDILGGDLVWGDADGINNMVTFQPYEPVPGGQAYRISFAGRDTADYGMNTGAEGESWWFATMPEATDPGPPEVLSVIPADGQPDVSVVPPDLANGVNSLYMGFQFSEAVTPASLEVNLALMELDGPGGFPVGSVPIDIIWMGSRAGFRPQDPLKDNTWYSINLGAGLEDLSGNTLIMPFVSEFLTGTARETGPVFMSPIEGAGDVEIFNPALAFYPDTGLDPGTVNLNNINIMDSQMQDQSHLFDLFYQKPSRGVWLFRNAESNFMGLEPGEVYTVHFGEGVTDLNGNPMETGGQDFTFTTTFTRGNDRPQLRHFFDGGVPMFPEFETGSVKVKLASVIRDQEEAWPGEFLTAVMSVDQYTATLDRFNGAIWAYQTEEGQSELIAPGLHFMDVTVTDSADNQYSLGHEVFIFDGPPVLVSPDPGAMVSWPPQVSWEPLDGAEAYLVNVWADEMTDQRLGAFLVQADGRMDDYTLTLPDNLPYPDNSTGWWSVQALANVDNSLAPWGFATSEKRFFEKDAQGPFLSGSIPVEGEQEVSPTATIQATLSDDGSGVDVDTISMAINSVAVDPMDLIIDATDPFNVVVEYTPTLPPNSSIMVQMDCMDLAGHPMQPPTGFGFQTREEIIINVPFDYPTIAEALDAAGPGDTIVCEPGLYSPTQLVLTERNSNVTLLGAGITDSVLWGVEGQSVITLDGVDNFTLKGFLIRQGNAGVELSHHADGTTDNRIEGNEIIANVAAGIVVTAEGYNLIQNNLIHDNDLAGISVVDVDEFSPTVPEPEITFNTIADNALGVDKANKENDDIYAGIYIDRAAPGIFNNIIATQGYYGISASIHQETNPVVDFNDVWDNFEADYLNVNPGPNDISEDPEFINPFPPDFDYRPGPGSPVVDALQLVPMPQETLLDIRDAVRPIGNGFDMGCYESLDPLPPVVISTVPMEYGYDVEPSTIIQVVLLDEELEGAESGVYTPSISMGINGMVIGPGDPNLELETAGADAQLVTVTYYPPLPLLADENYVITATCRDNWGNWMEGFQFDFTVRTNVDLPVPTTGYPSLQSALDAATAGDTILVQDDLLVDQTQFLGPRSADVRIVGEGFPMVAYNGDGPVFFLNGASNVLLRGLDIKGGDVGVEIGLHPEFTRWNQVLQCIIRDAAGPGVLITASGPNMVQNCLIRDNGGSGIQVEDPDANDGDTPEPELTFNTIVVNGQAGLHVINASPEAWYNILAINNQYGVRNQSQTPSLGYNDVWGNPVDYDGIAAGDGSISESPEFVDIFGDLFGLRPGSPVIDRLPVNPPEGGPGYPDVDLEGMTRPMGLSPEMGCYEYNDLALTPMAASLLIAGMDKEMVPCQISGGVGPYQAELTQGDGTVAQIIDMDHNAGTFTVEPLSGGTTQIRVMDSQFHKVVSGTFEIFDLTVEEQAQSPEIPAGDPYTLTIAEGDLAGFQLDLPPGVLEGDTVVTIFVSADGTPRLVEKDPADFYTLVGPSDAPLLADAFLDLPYNGTPPIEEVLAFWFDPILCRWINLDILGISGDTVRVKHDRFGLFALAVPTAFQKELAGVGEAADQQIHYRLMAFGANPAHVSGMMEILSWDENLGEYNDTRWRLFAFDSQRQGTFNPDHYYVEGPAFGDRFALAPGQAWWVIVRNTKVVTVPGLQTDPAMDWYTTLAAGWNSLGNPYSGQVDWTMVESSLNGIDWYAQDSADPDNPLAGELLYDYSPASAVPNTGGYAIRTQMENTVGYFVYNPAGGSLQLRIPATAVTLPGQGLGNKPPADKALQGAVVRTPPAPPTVAGDNPGLSVDSLGADKGVASGGGSCFVETASQGRASGFWILVAALILATAVRRFFTVKRGG